MLHTQRLVIARVFVKGRCGICGAGTAARKPTGTPVHGVGLRESSMGCAAEPVGGQGRHPDPNLLAIPFPANGLPHEADAHRTLGALHPIRFKTMTGLVLGGEERKALGACPRWPAPGGNAWNDG